MGRRTGVLIHILLGTFGLVMGLLLVLPLFAPAATRGDSINAGNRLYRQKRPFQADAVASFNRPWAIAILPDQRMLITERQGRFFLVTPAGVKTPIDNVPAVVGQGQNGLLDVATAPDFATSGRIYISYSAKGETETRLTLAVARLVEGDGTARLTDLTEIWRQKPEGNRGQPGGIILIDQSGQHLFLTVGDRVQPEGVQNPDAALGKVLRLNLDGSTPSDNPQASAGGVRGQTWTTGHRNPYGLAYAPDGRMWLHEMGPMGGDEFNLIEPGKNYGWPLVSNGDNYDGTLIPRHSTRPDFAAPAIYWNPVIAPAGLVFYEGAMFPQWRGSALIGGLISKSLVRVAFDVDGRPDEAERWDMGARIRDVAVAADGAVWLIEDGPGGRLLRLTHR